MPSEKKSSKNKQSLPKPPSFKNQNEMKEYVENTRQQLEKEIHKRLVEQLVLKVQKKVLSPEQQEHLERLYIDLKMINPELAFMTLKASGLVKSSPDSATKSKSKKSSSKSKHRSKSKSHGH